MSFELRWNGKTFASSSTGNLLLSSVPSGVQSFTIVFAGETPGEHIFSVTADNDSRAYSLRVAIDNSWSLFNLVDLTLIPGKYQEVNVKADLPRLPGAAPLVVSNDPPKEKIPVKNTEPVPVAVIEAKKKLPVFTAITKIFDKSGSGGIDQVYILTSDSKADTIALFIPVLEELPKTGTQPTSYIQNGEPLTGTATLYALTLSAPIRVIRVPSYKPTSK